MLDRVEQTARRFGMFSSGGRVGVAVSAGVDSAALLDALVKLRATFEIELAVVHVNHGLRGAESDGDEAFVAELAERCELPFYLRRCEVGAVVAESGGNLEEAARRARYGFFEELIREGVLDCVATGHTRSDQAETVLFRFLRGAGDAGLAGIRPLRAPGIARPLIDVSREETLRYVRENGLSWREDSTNSDLRFTRNRIRKELLPYLENEWNTGLAGRLAGVAERSLEDEEYWRQAVAQVSEGVVRREGGATLLSLEPLRRLPGAMLRRVLIAALNESRDAGSELGAGHVESLRGLVFSDFGTGILCLPGLVAQRSFGVIRLTSVSTWEIAEGITQDFDLELALPGAVDLPGGTSRVEARLCSEGVPGNSRGYNEGIEKLLALDRLPEKFAVRNWRPGDRLRPHGRKREYKLKELFQIGRVPQWQRRQWPVLSAKLQTSEGKPPQSAADHREVVLWTRRFGASADFAPGEDARQIVEIFEMDTSRI